MSKVDCAYIMTDRRVRDLFLVVTCLRGCTRHSTYTCIKHHCMYVCTYVRYTMYVCMCIYMYIYSMPYDSGKKRAESSTNTC